MENGFEDFAPNTQLDDPDITNDPGYDPYRAWAHWATRQYARMLQGRSWDFEDDEVPW